MVLKSFVGVLIDQVRALAGSRQSFAAPKAAALITPSGNAISSSGASEIDKLMEIAYSFQKLAQEAAAIKVWLDDVRTPPEGWVWVKTVKEAIQILSTGKVEEISLDHDLGDWETSYEGAEAGDLRQGAREKTGYDVVLWMAEHNAWPEIVRVHSQNPVGREKMEKTIDHYAPPGTRQPQAFAVQP